MSRKKDFRRRQRQSWLRFLRTVGPFAILAVMAGIAFLIFVPPTRAPIPVFYVGFDVSDDQNAIMNAKPADSIEKLQAAKKLWGGIQKNALLIFCDVVGRTGNVNDTEKPLIPEVFVPDTQDDYIQALYDEPANGTWKPFFEYLSEMADALAPTASARSPKYLIVALNVFHPDAPGGMPPQFNRFVKLVKDGWESNYDAPENIDLSLFLSHDFGQRNYQHSDPDKIGSHFKRTLDLYLQGKGVELSQIKEITLAELTDPETGLIQAVTESAARHELVQTPVLLRKSLSEPADVRLGSPEDVPAVGKYFVYRTRSDTPKKVDDWWRQLRSRTEHHHWEVENPFDLQRSNLLLLQYERRWYEGREPDTNKGIARMLDQILGARQTVDAPGHSLYDISLKMARNDDPRFAAIDDRSFDLKWLKASADGARPELDAWLGKAGGQFERKAYEVWDALASAKLLDKATLDGATELFLRSDFEFKLPVNEIVFMRRLGTELPSDDYPDTFLRTIRSAIKVRDLSNRFGANLNPVLINKFSVNFEQFENQRRVLEDRLFGMDLENVIDLVRSYDDLFKQYEVLLKEHDNELEEMKRLNRKLLEAPHAFRFAIEVLSNQQESDFDVKQIKSYGRTWASISSNNAMDANIADIKTTIEHWQQAHEMVCAGDMNVYSTTNIRVDNPADVATDERNKGRRLLLYWPGEFRYEVNGNQAKTTVNARKSVREILTESGIEDVGIAAERNIATNYLPLLELASNGFVAEESSVDDRQFLLPMMREVSESKESRLATLGGWPLIANAAKETHLTWPVGDSFGNNDSISKSVIKTLNQFHYLKSDLGFRRIAKDFCGTKIDGERYMNTALSMHNQIISADLDALEIDASARKEWQRANATVVGAGNSEDPWEQSRAELVDSAAAAFNDINANYWHNKDEHRSSNRDELYLDPDVEPTSRFREFVQTQFYQGNQFWISIRSMLQGEVQSTIAEPYQSDGTQLSWRYRKFENNQKQERDLYLRGWTIEKSLPEYETIGESSSRAIVYTPKQTETPLLEVRYSASKKRKNIAFLIDCSQSMKGEEWNDLQRQLSGVFERLLQRGDINIDLFAFGATKRVKTRISGKKRVVDNLPNGNIKYVLREDLSKWTKNGIQDVEIPNLKFPGDGSDDWDVIRYTGGNNLDELKEAIGELKPHGETPLFAALFHSIRMSKSRDLDFFVVMTDGIDFVSARKANNGRAAAPGPNQPEYNWSALTDQIAMLGRKEKTAEYNYDSNPAENTRGNNEQINLDKLSAFHKLVGESRKDDEQLSEFLDRLFPFPMLISEHRGNQQLFTPEQMNFEDRVQQVIVNNYLRTADRWKLLVRSDGKFKLNQPATWDSKIPLTGNEYLEFSYNPDGQLDLMSPSSGSGPKVTIQKTEIEINKEMGSSTFLREFGIHATPAYNFWSSDGQLTPSPAFAFISAMSPTGQTLLLQDYNEESSASNLRQIVFSKLDRSLLEKLGFGRNTSLTLNLKESRNDANWHELEFFDGQRFRLFDKALNKRLQLEKEDDQLLEGIAGNDGEYKITLRYDEIRGFREYSFSVSRSDPESDVPLDCWIIQVIGENGRRNNLVYEDMNQDLEPVERIYHFAPDQRLERVEHKFTFEGSLNRNFNAGQKGIFGLQKISDTGTEGFAQITSDDLE